jgi:glycosyltransferase involved in cell wall biosynthesis
MTTKKTAKKPVRRIGFDLSILDRVKTGTSVYAEHLFKTLLELDPNGFEFIALRSPRPLPRKNILTKFVNFGIEAIWLMVLLPLKARFLNLDLFHSPANIVSPVLRIPQVCTIHDAHFISHPQGRDPLWRLYANWSFRYAARHADRIICDTISAKKEIVKLLGATPDRVEVVYLGLPQRQSSDTDQKAAASFKPYILSVGATDPNKNLPSLLKAFARLVRKKRHAGHRLVLAGPPGRDQSTVETIIEHEKLGEQVLLLGQVTDSQLAALYKNASLFVFPSFCEGFGFPPLEAMSYGVPVVASNAPCIPETLGEAAIFFDPYNVAEIAAKIDDVLSSKQLQQKLAQAGLARAKKFTWKKTAEKTVEIYRSLLDSLHET